MAEKKKKPRSTLDKYTAASKPMGTLAERIRRETQSAYGDVKDTMRRAGTLEKRSDGNEVYRRPPDLTGGRMEDPFVPSQPAQREPRPSGYYSQTPDEAAGRLAAMRSREAVAKADSMRAPPPPVQPISKTPGDDRVGYQRHYDKTAEDLRKVLRQIRMASPEDKPGLIERRHELEAQLKDARRVLNPAGTLARGRDNENLRQQFVGIMEGRLQDLEARKAGIRGAITGPGAGDAALVAAARDYITKNAESPNIRRLVATNDDFAADYAAQKGLGALDPGLTETVDEIGNVRGRLDAFNRGEIMAPRPAESDASYQVRLARQQEEQTATRRRVDEAVERTRMMNERRRAMEEAQYEAQMRATEQVGRPPEPSAMDEAQIGQIRAETGRTVAETEALRARSALDVAQAQREYDLATANMTNEQFNAEVNAMTPENIRATQSAEMFLNEAVGMNSLNPIARVRGAKKAADSLDRYMATRESLTPAQRANIDSMIVSGLAEANLLDPESIGVLDLTVPGMATRFLTMGELARIKEAVSQMR
jgi:hypothetical protein